MNRRIQEHYKRRATASRAYSDYSVVPLEDGPYRVEKVDGTTYLVNLDAGTCTCPDFQRRIARREELAGVWCKHMHLCAASFGRSR